MYGTLIDAGCLALLWRLTRREGIGLFALVGFERTRLARDALLGFVLIPVSLMFILGGILISRPGVRIGLGIESGLEPASAPLAQYAGLPLMIACALALVIALVMKETYPPAGH